MISTQLYDTLNKAWKSTCRVVLGGEVGELSDFEGWLGEYLPPAGKRVSAVSGKPVTLANPHYPDAARFVSMEEATGRKVDALGINEIKDIDSIVRAVSEQWEYTGNRVLGNSALVESSDIVADSQSVWGSTDISQSQYVYSSFLVRSDSKYVFGSGWFGRTQFAIRHVGGFSNSRIMESPMVTDSSDIFFSHSLAGCMDVMFSFSQRSRRHMIGNLELPKDKYTALKAKLLAEVREELAAKKRFPSLMEMTQDAERKAGTGSRKQDGMDNSGGRRGSGRFGHLSLSPREEKTSMEPIEKAFASTFKVIFGYGPEKMEKYEDWLMTNIPPITYIESPFGRKTYLPDDPSFSCLSKFPGNRTVSIYEAMELGKRRMDEKSLGSLESIREGLPGIAFFTMEWNEGENSNNIKSPVVHHGSNSYRVYDVTYSEYAALGSMSQNSKYTFGCYRVVESQFCVKCYNSLKLSRCFEVDSSSSCLDSMFCHNSEGLSDAMFCFNAKGKRHAIGNAELGPDGYRGVKSALLRQIADELESKGSTEWNVFRMGSKAGPAGRQE